MYDDASYEDILCRTSIENTQFKVYLRHYWHRKISISNPKGITMSIKRLTLVSYFERGFFCISRENMKTNISY